MDQRQFKRAFDEIKMDNINPTLDADCYTITDASCMVREQLGLNKLSPWPIHVANVHFEFPTLEELLEDSE
jgi:antitoxin component HigA of HigAB toxin-antitoxin module